VYFYFKSVQKEKLKQEKEKLKQDMCFTY